MLSMLTFSRFYLVNNLVTYTNFIPNINMISYQENKDYNAIIYLFPGDGNFLEIMDKKMEI